MNKPYLPQIKKSQKSTKSGSTKNNVFLFCNEKINVF